MQWCPMRVVTNLAAWFNMVLASFLQSSARDTWNTDRTLVPLLKRHCFNSSMKVFSSSPRSSGGVVSTQSPIGPTEYQHGETALHCVAPCRGWQTEGRKHSKPS